MGLVLCQLLSLSGFGAQMSNGCYSVVFGLAAMASFDGTLGKNTSAKLVLAVEGCAEFKRTIASQPVRVHQDQSTPHHVGEMPT